MAVRFGAGQSTPQERQAVQLWLHHLFDYRLSPVASPKRLWTALCCGCDRGVAARILLKAGGGRAVRGPRAGREARRRRRHTGPAPQPLRPAPLAVRNARQACRTLSGVYPPTQTDTLMSQMWPAPSAPRPQDAAGVVAVAAAAAPPEWDEHSKRYFLICITKVLYEWCAAGRAMGLLLLPALLLLLAAAHAPSTGGGRGRCAALWRSRRQAGPPAVPHHPPWARSGLYQMLTEATRQTVVSLEGMRAGAAAALKQDTYQSALLRACKQVGPAAACRECAGGAPRRPHAPCVARRRGRLCGSQVALPCTTHIPDPSACNTPAPQVVRFALPACANESMAGIADVRRGPRRHLARHASAARQRWQR
jgi:hypothetical protein